MAVRAVAFVTRFRFKADKVHERLTAEVFSKQPGLGFRKVHERRFNHKIASEPERQRHLQAL